MDQEDNLSEGLPGFQKIVIPVIQEELLVGKKMVETGKVYISKKVYEEEFIQNEPVTSEEVIVERKEINQYIDVAPPAVRQEGDITIISVIKEVLVVEKRLMLVEELHIKKHIKTDSAVIKEILRKEEINVTRNISGTDF